ncbi:MAG: LPS-assembly protein LptD [Pseudomonadota bacterium]
MQCFAPPGADDLPPPAPEESLTRVLVEADSAQVSSRGESVLTGDVTVTYEGRQLRADEVRYDPQTRRMRASGNVRLLDPLLRIDGTTADYAPESAAGSSFSDASFKLLDQPGRGGAERIRRVDDDVAVLENVTYTGCPEQTSGWRLRAPYIRLDREKDVGTARNVRITFQGVPILYAPWLTFPLSDKRKSGLLTPSFGASRRSGTDIAIPWYWNIRPNIDATFTPRLLTDRGTQLRTDFRYLLPKSEGEARFEFLSNDDQTGRNRSFGTLYQQTRISDVLTLTADLARASDGNYLEDFGGSLSGASITHLERRVDLTLREERWNLLARVQDFQTLDASIPRSARPYERVPQLVGGGRWPNLWKGIDFALDGELVNFDRADGVTGVRLDTASTFSVPLTRRGITVLPAVTVSHTRYALADLEETGIDSSPSRTLPIVSLDARATFERQPRKGGPIQLLEPRIRYTYIPFREQDDLPVFDTGAPDLNLVQLFRSNRFAGTDRIGDANQVSVGVTGRLIDQDNGKEFLTATVGSIISFADEDVTIPAGRPEVDDLSDLLAEVGLRLADRWNADVGLQFDAGTRSWDKAAVRVQFRPGKRSVVNVGYRFRDDDLEQTDLSFAFPLGNRWEFVGRWNYSLDERETLERFVGVGYESCCWALRLVQRNFVSTRLGDRDNQFYVQFTLKGLTSIGSATSRLLDRGILGYSDL